MPNQKHLVVLPFEDILEDYKEYDSFLWFYRGGVREMIREILINLSLCMGRPIEVIDLNELYSNLHGDNLPNSLINDYHHALNELDNCNASITLALNEEKTIVYIFNLLVDRVTQLLKIVFKNCNVWNMDTNYHPRWIGNKLVFLIHDSI